MSDSPSTHGSNGGLGDGRIDRGRFGKGNRYGKGNPLAGRAAKLRAVLLKRVKDKDMVEVVDALIAQAKAGELNAIKEFLNRCIGTPVPQDIEERLAALEAAQEGKANG